MSRTYRKSKYPLYIECSYYTSQINSGIESWTSKTLNEKELEELKQCLDRHIWRLRTGNNKWPVSLPHWFRNDVNRNRRAKDKREIWKATHWKDYPEQCDMWNCKSNNAWGYW